MMLQKIIIALGLTTFSAATLAAPEDNKLVVGGALGTNATYEVLIGTRNERTTSDGMFYLSHYHTEQGINLDGADLGGTYSSTRLGMQVDTFSRDNSLMNLFLYKNATDGVSLLNRYGLGVGFGYGSSLSPEMKISIDGEIMPQYVSTNWKDDVTMEYGIKIRGIYRINHDISAGIHYTHNGALVSISGSNFSTLGGNIGADIRMNF